MKKITVIVLLFVSIDVSAQNISLTDSIIKFGVTEKGKPDGEKSEIKIDKTGGSIQSSDGKVELIFPAGAVTKKTNISIQPVTNFASNSNGKAYMMEPSGLIFQQPVKIIFHYKETDTDGSVADLMGIAMQDDKGLWIPAHKVVLDTVSKTIKADIQHFTSFVNYMWSKLKPVSARVKVKGSLRLQIVTLAPDDEWEDNELLEPLTKTQNEIPQIWSVNNIAKGNNTVGFISASQDNSAIYQAPSQVPDQNPVAVTVEHSYSSSVKNLNNVRLVSNILIYGDAWEVKMVASLKGGTSAAWGGVVTYKDQGSFVVSLEKNKPAVIGIKNNLETIADNCSKIILNPNTCTGIIHITGIKEIKVTPGQPDPVIEIAFIQRPSEFTKVQYTCPPPPGYKGGAASGAISSFPQIPAFPMYIKFTAKEGEQTLQQIGEPGGELFLKITARKINDE